MYLFSSFLWNVSEIEKKEGGDMLNAERFEYGPNIKCLNKYDRHEFEIIAV